MKKRRMLRRILCVLCTAALLVDAASMNCGSDLSITVSVPEAASGGVRVKDLAVEAYETVSAVPYIANATMDELHGIIAYALGEDPTEGKALEDEGQNTKNNVAISLLRLAKTFKYCRTIRFVLEPYEGSETVFELCAYVRRFLRKDEERIRMGILYDRGARKISAVNGTGMMGIGYDFNYDFDTFSAASDPWQRNFGFCRLYDGSAYLIGDVYETIRVPFRYGGKDWMVQIWKGIYSWNMLGGEVGLYNKPIDRKADFYDCASDPERLRMSFTVLLGDETIVQTDFTPSWWQTAFTKHRIVSPSDLTMELSLEFPNSEMLCAFRDSLKNVQPDVLIRRNGLALDCIWPGRS